MADLVGDGNIVADAEITNIQAKSETRREYKNYNDLKDVKDIKDINDLKKKENETKLTSYYNGIVDMTLTLKDAKTGEVIATPSFSCSGSGNSDNSTVDKAIRGAINRLVRDNPTQTPSCRECLAQTPRSPLRRPESR